MNLVPSPARLEPTPERRTLACEPYRAGQRRPVVLVVDDDANVREMLSIGLGGRGFDVKKAVGGAHAIEICQQDRDAVVAALIDKRMPGVHGFSTLAAIRQIAPHVRCWLITGDCDEYTKEELEQLGAAGVIYKPFNLNEVARLLGA